MAKGRSLMERTVCWCLKEAGWPSTNRHNLCVVELAALMVFLMFYYSCLSSEERKMPFSVWLILRALKLDPAEF